MGRNYNYSLGRRECRNQKKALCSTYRGLQSSRGLANSLIPEYMVTVSRKRFVPYKIILRYMKTFLNFVGIKNNYLSNLKVLTAKHLFFRVW